MIGGVTDVSAPAANCPNCGRLLDGRYCADCGQKAAPINPSLRDVVEGLAYGGTTARAMLRTAAVGLAYLVVVAVAITAIVAPILVRFVS